MNIHLKNTLRSIYYGWQDAGAISTSPDFAGNRVSLYLDILRCCRTYHMTSAQYKASKFYSLSNDEKDRIGSNFKDMNQQRDKWETEYFQNWKFFKKYADIEYETSSIKRVQRLRAYTKRFGFGKNCLVQHGVKFICEHCSIGSLSIGNDVLFARNVDIDYTGDLEIGNDVKIMEGVKILTHAHDTFHSQKDSRLIPLSNRAYKTNLRIGNHVRIASHAIILPGVQEIGDNSFISAGAVVDQRVPENVIVAGNPAKVIAKIPAIVLRRIYPDV